MVEGEYPPEYHLWRTLFRCRWKANRRGPNPSQWSLLI